MKYSRNSILILTLVAFLQLTNCTQNKNLGQNLQNQNIQKSEKIEKNARFLSGSEDHGHEHHEDSNYNCPSNCILCGYSPPHVCTTCLFKYFPDKKANLCKICPIERCNLCKTENSCSKCRVGHQPNGEDGGKTCVVSNWFKLVSYLILWSSMGISLFFFGSCFYFVFKGQPSVAPSGAHPHGSKVHPDLHED